MVRCSHDGRAVPGVRRHGMERWRHAARDRLSSGGRATSTTWCSTAVTACPCCACSSLLASETASALSLPMQEIWTIRRREEAPSLSRPARQQPAIRQTMDLRLYVRNACPVVTIVCLARAAAHSTSRCSAGRARSRISTREASGPRDFRCLDAPMLGRQ